MALWNYFSQYKIIIFLRRFKDTLTQLTFSDEVNISNKTIDKFKALKQLHSLHLFGAKLTTNSVQALGKLKNLRELRIPGCEKLSSSDLCSLLSSFNELRVVDLSDCGRSVTNKVKSLLPELLSIHLSKYVT